ncbi:hypothetical protein TNCV_4819711 [Trichonephila clavipes]|nr:hypothetical protein TNCV_4819711 [Trichonephila clavipes]
MNAQKRLKLRCIGMISFVAQSIFMDDNVCPQTARLDGEWLEIEDILRIEEPGISPDLNFVERFCDAFGRGIAAPRFPP